MGTERRIQMSAQKLFSEALEPRRLMSVSVGTSLFDSAVKLDRLQVHADLVKFRSDAVSADVTLLSDRITLRGDNVAAATTVVPLIAKLHTDVKSMRLQLLEDRLTEKSNALRDESVIIGDLRQILIDRNNPTALAADRTKLKSDRITLQNDLIAGLDSRIATRQSFHDTLFADGQAIGAAVQTDPNASAKLKTDVAKWLSDGAAKLNTMEADLTKLAADRTQLVADLTASQG
jgi:hypothetical protein